MSRSKGLTSALSCQFDQFSTKILEFEQLTGVVHDSLMRPWFSFEDLVRNADKIIERMEKEQQTQTQGAQEMGVHMSNTLHDLRSALQIDQLADDLHLVSQIALRFQQQGVSYSTYILCTLTGLFGSVKP